MDLSPSEAKERGAKQEGQSQGQASGDLTGNNGIEKEKDVARARPLQSVVVASVAKDVGREGSTVSSTPLSSSSLVNGLPPSPKRSRADGQGIKYMPKEYKYCDVKDLGLLISDMLLELIRLNDRIPLQDGILTRFHSR
jgi:hypothetical protein